VSPTIRGKRLVGATAVSAALLASLVLSSAGPSGASSVNHSSIPAATRALAALKVRPTKIPVSAKISKPIPKHKTIDFVVCGVPQCAILAAPLAAAAKFLGWKVVDIAGGLTPTSIGAAWSQAVHNHPSAVMGTGFPEVLFSSQVATLKADKIPVINGFVTDTTGKGVVAIINGQPSYTKAGKALADFVLGTDGTTASSLFIGSTTFPASTFEQNAFVAENAQLCSSCAEVNLDEAATATQSQVINDVVAKITADPSINFVVASQPTYAAGLPQALKTAGFPNVKILVNTPDPTTLGYLKAGEIAGIMNVPNTDAMNEFIDALARYEVHTSVAPSEVAGGDWAVTQATASQVTAPYFLVKGALAQYEKLWK
jgi:ABC-type sugar transport system substrate-binding protein